MTWLVDPAWIAETLREHGKRDVHGYMALATGKKVYSRNKIDVVNLARLK